MGRGFPSGVCLRAVEDALTGAAGAGHEVERKAGGEIDGPDGYPVRF